MEIPISSSSQTQVAMNNVCINVTFKIHEFGFFLGGSFVVIMPTFQDLRRKLDASKLTSGKLSLSLSIALTYERAVTRGSF
jgi:hypothetical protein